MNSGSRGEIKSDIEQLNHTKHTLTRILGIVRVLVFMLALFAVVYSINYHFMRDPEFVTSDMMYELPDDSIDVMFFGSSIYARSISPDTIWDMSGISSYNRSSGRLGPRMTWLYLMDSLKVQSPKVVFIYTPQLIKSASNNVYEQRNIDPLRWSKEKVSVVKEILSETKSQSVWEYVFPLVVYHNKWEKELEMLVPNAPKRNFARGQAPKWRKRTERDPDYNLKGRIDDSKKPQFSYNSEALKYYSKTIEECLSKGITPVLLSPPSLNWDNEQHHATRGLADTYGIDFIDMNTDELLDEIGIDQKTDFYDHYGPEHMNGFGATKVSAYLVSYMNDKFDLPDTRTGESKATKLWEKDVKEYKLNYRKYLKQINYVGEAV